MKQQKCCAIVWRAAVVPSCCQYFIPEYQFSMQGYQNQAAIAQIYLSQLERLGKLAVKNGARVDEGHRLCKSPLEGSSAMSCSHHVAP